MQTGASRLSFDRDVSRSFYRDFLSRGELHIREQVSHLLGITARLYKQRVFDAYYFCCIQSVHVAVCV